VDLGDDDGEALEHHRRDELPVAPFLHRRGARGAEASRPPKRPEEKTRDRRRSGVGGEPAGTGSVVAPQRFVCGSGVERLVPSTRERAVWARKQRAKLAWWAV
jgi:hypothetical protein